jgi:hypothetical protein
MAAAGEIAQWETHWWGLEPAKGDTRFVRGDGLRLFPEAGVAVAHVGDGYLVATNGRVGTNGFGNHKHNDQLGFEYHVCGVPLFVDPGSYVYTRDPAARNLFRGTRVHNTLTVDSAEQNDFKAEWLFRMFAPPRAPELGAEYDCGAVTIHGRHFGYQRLDGEVTHERTFVLTDERLAIADVVSGRGTHAIAWHFHCAPGVDVSPGRSPSCVVLRSGDVALELRLPDGVTVAIAEAWYSPSYGRRERCAAIDATTRASLDGGPVRWEIAAIVLPRDEAR